MQIGWTAVFGAESALLNGWLGGLSYVATLFMSLGTLAAHFASLPTVLSTDQPALIAMPLFKVPITTPCIGPWLILKKASQRNGICQGWQFVFLQAFMLALGGIWISRINDYNQARRGWFLKIFMISILINANLVLGYFGTRLFQTPWLLDLPTSVQMAVRDISRWIILNLSPNHC